MKHFWVFAFVSIILTAFFGGFTFPEKGYASVSDTEITNLIVNNKSNFNSFSPALADNYEMMVNSVASRLKNDPDINIYQLSRYVLEGIPGATEPNQQGFIPLIKGEIAFGKANNKADLAQRATLVLASAEQILANTITNEQRAAGIITTDQATEQMSNASQAAGAKTSLVLNERAKKNCSFTSSSPIIDCIDIGLTWLVKSVILNIVGFFLWMSANLLNFAMYHGVFKFSDFAPKEIYNIWLVVRQIISLFVFFAALAVGFMAIIGKSEEFKKYIVFLIVFGLFVNFSYPVVRVFVDVSNVVSLQIYQTTLGKDILLTDNPSGDGTAGARIMRSMGLQGLVVSATSLPDSANKDDGFIKDVTSLPGAIAIVGIVGSTAYILFMIAIMLIVRTALLVCIIVASPILLVDTVVPFLGEKAKWLRGMFISQLFMAPVFTIMLALTLKFLDIFSELNKGPSALTSTGANTAAVFFNLMIMLIMLWIMYKVTKAVAGEVGNTVTNWAGKAGGMGVGLTAGTTMAGLGFGGRQFFGRIGEKMGQQGGVIGDIGRKMAGAKYDLRNLKTVQGGAKMIGVDVGKGVDKNRKELLAERNAGYIKTAEGSEDDEARQKYFNRTVENKPFNAFGFAGTPNSKEYRKFTSNDEDTIKQYVNTDEKGRVRMRDDDKNKKYLQRFGYVDANAEDKMSPETLKAVKAKKARTEADEARNESRVAGYMTADQLTRDNILANAIKAGDDKLIKQLEAMDKLSGGDKKIDIKTIKEEELKKALNVLDNPTLEKKVADNILGKQKLDKASEGEANALAATNKAINKMIKDNKSLTAAIRSLVNNKVPLSDEKSEGKKEDETGASVNTSTIDDKANPTPISSVYTPATPPTVEKTPTINPTPRQKEDVAA